MPEIDILKVLSGAPSRANSAAEQSAAAVRKQKRAYIPDEWILVCKTGIAGLQFHADPDTEAGRRILNGLTPGTPLKLVREYQNEHDPWAVAVYTEKDEMLGYVTRYKNEPIARLMDAGKVFHAVVDKPSAGSGSAEENAPTENYTVPYSVYMDDGNFAEDDEGEEA